MRTISLLSAFLLFATLTSAQGHPRLRVLPEPPPGGAQLAARAPEVIRVTYDVQKGALRDRRSVPAGTLSFGSACFDNSDLVCDMTAFDPYTIGDLPGDELLDWGVKDCDGTGMIQSATFAYRTTALDPADGGPGATLSVALYRGTRGFNRPGVEIFRATLTGLPGQDAPAGNPHEAPFVFLTFDFGAQPLSLPDGPIGWGYMLLDNLEAQFATGALLVQAPNPALGTIDALDVYQPGPPSNATYSGTFNFGTLCNHPPCCPDASTWLQLVETTPGATLVNGSGVNPAVFTELLPARLGQAWVTSFDLSAWPNATHTLILLSSRARAPFLTPRGELLVDLTGAVSAPHVSASALHVVPIPLDMNLAGFVLHTQGVVRSPGVVLTNGLDITIGF